MQFTNISGGQEIGSNSYFINLANTGIILDTGMHPKREGWVAVPQYNDLPPNAVEAIFLSHAHLDHLGTLPVVQEKQPCADVFMTPGTAALAETMLHNSVNVMSSKRTDEGIVEYPLFNHKDIDRLSDSWCIYDCNASFRIGYNKSVLATFYDAGHILGSSGIMLESENESVFYTGDVQFEDQSIIPGADFPTSGVDTLIMECTRGSAERCVHYSRPHEMKRLADSIVSTLARGGAVLIPVFAIGKSQEMLYNLHLLKEQGIIHHSTPIIFGGLCSKVTNIYDKFASSTRRHNPDLSLKDLMPIVPLPKRDKAPLMAQPGNIYLVSSGMMNEHTASNLFAEQLLGNPRNSILFVGYCDADSPAGHLLRTPAGELVRMRKKGQPVRRSCTVEQFDFSGHATRELLLEYTVQLSPKRVFLIHGDPDAVEWMQDAIKQAAPQIQTIIPEPGVCYQFD